MRYLFKQSVSLKKKDYPKGTHEVSEEVENHPHFADYVRAGYVVPCVESEKLFSPNSSKARGESLLSTLKQRRAKPSAECAVVKDETEAVAEVAPEAAVEKPEEVKQDAIEEDAGEDELNKSAKKKRNRK